MNIFIFLRLDKDQKERKQLQEITNVIDPDYYEYEAQIFFDDAMITKNGNSVLNNFVLNLLTVINEAAS